MRIFVTLLILLATSGCTSVIKRPDGAVEVRTFGASTVTVEADGKIETESPGLSEGATDVLAKGFEAVLRLVSGIGSGLAGVAK